ncbi:hypothetical protein J3Q64DRAFT_1836317 [Phycomyces blakesleeanus]|uniref:Uncharacterized protein n=2 Tax=Phycomyces blakesleeanus TaxID=4837 RepID=A0A162U740_PHYB8|nr:hypothetical protein PHYBLDRAFT_168402 [Phycomyces blakesleeanus NRRL 1555(-)]OAD73992.1 hypothetical protein PHYBLDRAFT_168402 [Phycomyces blakesleeanus NRRL 1555(-)]|eukprot:XP_018292032.1 hypothetical protein PHYBLDRAFT_168402 [Phycomyces blakesleeanus NRRL 1555(-)]
MPFDIQEPLASYKGVSSENDASSYTRFAEPVSRLSRQSFRFIDERDDRLPLPPFESDHSGSVSLERYSLHDTAAPRIDKQDSEKGHPTLSTSYKTQPQDVENGVQNTKNPDSFINSVKRFPSKLFRKVSVAHHPTSLQRNHTAPTSTSAGHYKHTIYPIGLVPKYSHKQQECFNDKGEPCFHDCNDEIDNKYQIFSNASLTDKQCADRTGCTTTNNNVQLPLSNSHSFPDSITIAETPDYFQSSSPLCRSPTRKWISAILVVTLGSLIALAFVMIGLGKALGSNNTAIPQKAENQHTTSGLSKVVSGSEHTFSSLTVSSPSQIIKSTAHFTYSSKPQAD